MSRKRIRQGAGKEGDGMRKNKAKADASGRNGKASRRANGTAGQSGEPSGIFAEAYFTVEAALVMPVVLCILVMIIYLSFYLYDRCVLAQDCYVLSYRQSIEKGNADRISPEKIREQFGEKLFMLSSLDTGTSAGGTIKVTGNAEMSPPLFGIPAFEGENSWKIGVERKAKKTDPPRDYRRVRRLLNLAARAVSGQTSASE